MGSTPSRFIRHDLMCTDVATGIRFYCELFNWTTTEIKVMGASVFRLLVRQKIIGAIMPFDKGFGFPSHWMPYVSVDSVEDCCKRIIELGGEVCIGATEFPPGRFAVANDPQKALFSPFTPRDRNLAGPSAPAGPGEFCWDELLTSDIAGAKKFYTSLFSWESMEWDMGPAGQHTLFTGGGQSFAGMLKMPENATHRPMWLAYVNVQDVDATTAHAKELGGKVALAPADIPDIGRFAVLIDPTDATIAIHKPKA